MSTGSPANIAADCIVLRHGSAELVELAEAKMRGEATDPAAYARILDGLLTQPGGDRIDTVVLACTHFPLVQAELAAAAPRPLAFVDGKEGIARRTAWLSRGPRLARLAGRGRRLLHRPARRMPSPIAPASPVSG